jgi:putative ABC transport system substrate-binding protein
MLRGNITGFMNYEYSFGGKKLELLKQIAPNVKRVTVFRDPANPAASAELAAIQALGQLLDVEVHPIDSRKDLGRIERAITTFAKSPPMAASFSHRARLRHFEAIR